MRDIVTVPLNMVKENRVVCLSLLTRQVNHLPTNLRSYSNITILFTWNQYRVVASLAETRAIITEFAHITIFPSRSEIQTVIWCRQGVSLRHQHLKLWELVIIHTFDFNRCNIFIIRNREPNNPLLVSLKVESMTFARRKN